MPAYFSSERFSAPCFREVVVVFGAFRSLSMSAEEADKTATADGSGGDEEEEWLYGGKKIPSTKLDFYI